MFYDILSTKCCVALLCIAAQIEHESEEEPFLAKPLLPWRKHAIT